MGVCGRPLVCDDLCGLSRPGTLRPPAARGSLLLIGGAVILLFNTAAILAMLRHYREDRDFMYGLDIKFLDEAQRQEGLTMAHYTPPKQGKASQLIDVIVLVVLTVGALFVPLWMGLAGAAKTVADARREPHLGDAGSEPRRRPRSTRRSATTPPAAHDLILARFDYSFSIGALLTMVVVIVLYYVLILRFSEVEYREVISEKFGE